jgi:hypothetical protein
MLKPFSAWGEIFGDEVVAAAMIDRLVHHAEILALKGDSYRLRDKDLGPAPVAGRLTDSTCSESPYGLSYAGRTPLPRGVTFQPAPGGDCSTGLDRFRLHGAVRFGAAGAQLGLPSVWQTASQEDLRPERGGNPGGEGVDLPLTSRL